MTLSSTGVIQKPALDENSFQQLLAAAYVVQQHNDLHTEKLGSAHSQVLSVIAEIQGQIRARNLNVAAASALIADQLLTMTRANGVSISLITDGYLDCVAEAGAPSKIPGSCVSSHSIVATERLKAGGIFESEDAQTDMRLDVGLCRTVGVGSLIAAPILRFGEIAGLIEVRWNQPGAFGEADLRSCRLMAGLTTGTLERSVRIGKAQEFRNDSQTSPAPLSLDPVSSDETDVTTAPLGEVVAPPISETVKSASISDPDAEQLRESEESAKLKTPPHEKTGLTCRVCGRPFSGNETFCGFCSMPRTTGSPPDNLQSKWASLWYMKRAQGALEDVDRDTLELGTKQDITESPPRFARLPADVENVTYQTPLTRALQPRSEAFATRVPGHDSSVSETMPFEEGRVTASAKRALLTLQKRWRDGILALVAVSLALGLASAWPRNDSQLTWFQSLMIRFGVSRGPVQVPVFGGRPDARVWLDVHTTLYYCEGSDMYGKTPDGNFTSQHDAQRSGFEPASGAACP